MPEFGPDSIRMKASGEVAPFLALLCPLILSGAGGGNLYFLDKLSDRLRCVVLLILPPILGDNVAVRSDDDLDDTERGRLDDGDDDIVTVGNDGAGGWSHG